jgi:hypothetical protein
VLNLLIVGAAAMAAYQGPPLIASYDPPSARVMRQRTTLGCSGVVLEVDRPGSQRSGEEAAEVRFNGRPLRGSALQALQRDLSKEAGVYRIGGRCPDVRGRIVLILNVGEKQRTGEVIYSRASATIRNGMLEQYTGMTASDEEAFWFR